MNRVQFQGLKDQVEAVGEVSVVAQDEPGLPTNIVSTNQDWYIRASVDLEAVPKETYKIVFQVYLEDLTAGKKISGPESSDEKEWSSQIKHYDFQVNIKEKSVPTGLYRISAIIMMQDKNLSNLVLGYADVGLIEIYPG